MATQRNTTTTPVLHVQMRRDGKWVLRQQGQDRNLRVMQTQAQVMEVARDVGRRLGARVLVHNLEGRVRRETDYSV